jgi:hypothetical protein
MKGEMISGKRAQFFILAAVILSAVIISLGMTANYVRVNREPENFYDFSYEIKKESGAVIDYQIFSDFDEDTNLTQFVDLLAEDILDKDPDANFIFIYGEDVGGMKGRNYGVSDAETGGESSPGRNRHVENNLRVGIGGVPVGGTVGGRYGDYFDVGEFVVPISGGKVEVSILDQKYDFPVSEHKQVIFILTKSTDDESFVSVE